MTMRPLRVGARVCGMLLIVIAGAMAVCAGVDEALGGRAALSFLIPAVLGGGVGVALFYGHGKPDAIDARGVIVAVCMGWTVISLFAAAPLALGLRLSLVDAVFEAASGLTTTGATVLTGLDRISPGLLFWRSLLQWLGGIGILAMGLVLLPSLGIGGMQISKAESSDISDLSRRAGYRTYSAAVLAVYLGLTFACAVTYRMLGMEPFEAINHAFTTLATGGFSTHDASFGFYADNHALLAAATLFMLLASLPFSLYVAVALHRSLDSISQAQIYLFLALVAFFVAICELFSEVSPPFIHVAFNVASVISTTGYASEDYLRWGDAAVVALLLATFVGGCAGSTSGGFKVYRLIVIFEFLKAYLARLATPHIVTASDVALQRSGDRTLAVIAFITLFFLSFILLTVGLLATGLDAVTAFSGALTTLSNVGPGVGGVIGPVGNFQPLPDAAKALLTIGMIIGRLELLAVAALLHPGFWR